MQCFPCLKFFEGGKMICSVALVIVGAMMIVQEPKVIDCNAFTAKCPAAFQGLLNATLTSGKVLAKDAFSNEIASYCGCLSSCMNYFSVYGDNKTSTDKNNCYAKSIAAGVAGNSTPSGNDAGMLGMTAKGQCSSCEDIQGSEGKVFRALGGIAVLCAVALAASSTCEVVGVKLRNRLFSLCTLSTDVIVMILLGVAAVIAGIWFGLSRFACDPDSLSNYLEKAGDSATDGQTDEGAKFYKFLIDLFGPLAGGLCGQSKKFAVFCLASSMAYVFTQFTVIATICICCKCSKDKKIKHIHHAKEVQKLMGSSSDEE